MSVDVPKVRTVFDCMIFLQGAARRESPAGACLLLVELRAIELYVSPETMSELRDVLSRPRVRQRFPALTEEMVNQFLMSIETRALVVPDVPRIFQFERDPDDEPYINLAIAAKASYLVSRDNDILDLADASTADGERLRNVAPELRIVDPVAFLAEMRETFKSPTGH